MTTKMNVPTTDFTPNEGETLDFQAFNGNVFGPVTDLLKAPKHIRVDDYLKKYIERTEDPSILMDNAEAYNTRLIEFGAGALDAKIADVEMFNMDHKASKKRVPDKLSFADVAILMMSLYTFRNIQMTDREEDVITAMYDVKKGIYVTRVDVLYQRMDRLSPDFRTKDMADVLDKIKRSVPTVEQTEDRHLFAVENGIFNKKTGKLEPFSSDYVFLTKIPVLYKEQPVNPVIVAKDGYQWDVESWLLDIMNDDADSTTLIWQVIADCLQPHYSRHKSIWFYSEKGNNGKGTIGQLIKNLLGRGNYSSLSVEDYNHEFLKETLLGVGANISDENDVGVFIDSMKDYKASVTGDDININRKYEKPLRIQLRMTNIQMMNGLPKTKDKSDSFYRRLILVPFLKSFTNNGERKYIKDDYINRQDVLEYVLHKALNMDFDEYIMPEASAKLLEDYREENNPVQEFWNEYQDQFVWDLLPSEFLYSCFTSWYGRNNPSGKVMQKNSFLKDLRNVIDAQGNKWLTDKKVRVKTDKGVLIRMVEDEPLITEFGLSGQWIKQGYGGTSLMTLREFPRKDQYRGFLRA